MSLDDRIVEAVEGNAATTVAGLANACATTPQVIKMRLGKIVKGGRLKWNGDELEVGDEGSAAAAAIERAAAPRRAARKGAAEPEPEAEILFSADEDGDLQLSRRDGEGEILCVPGAEIGRLIAFIKRNFKEALR